MVLGNLPKPDHPDYADAEEFLASAYNLSTKLTFSERTSGTIEPEIGREPLYPLYLAVLMKVDPVFGQFDLRCLNKERDCNQIYKSAQWSNSIFIENKRLDEIVGMALMI